ncbi:MAG: hypothetical protein DRH04_01910 [Deltaproteobacteria bacterium]|nr:MAG: hypothetical protein DRH04_01910 [Deltaproteobacteria bacterium]
MTRCGLIVRYVERTPTRGAMWVVSAGEGKIAFIPRRPDLDMYADAMRAAEIYSSRLDKRLQWKVLVRLGKAEYAAL